jgi:hypothetical protein
MPVRDGRPFVASAIRSVLTQSFSEFELVVVDDGSSDGTDHILRRAAHLDSRVRVLSQSRLGLVAALNTGLEKARGELIARMDADDLAYPNRLERQVAFMREHPRVGALGTATRIIDWRGNVRGAVRYPTHDRQIRQVLRTRMAFCHPTTIARATLLNHVGGYRPAFIAAEDYDLWLRLAERTTLANLPEPLLAYRAHRRQVSANAIEQQVICAEWARQAALARRAHLEDPFEARALTLDQLVGLGHSPANLANTVVRDLATRAVHFASLGDLEMAARLLLDADSRGRRIDLQPSVRAHLSVARACVLMHRRQLLPALTALAAAARASPSSVLGLTWRRLRLSAGSSL